MIMSSKTKTNFKDLGYQIGKEQIKLGRPLKGNEALSDSFTFRLSERECQCLRDYAWRHDQAPSDVIREALSLLSITGF
jgi:hypothetical protein